MKNLLRALFPAALLAVTPSLLAQTFADLAVSKSGPEEVVAGEDATYTITVTNFGPDAATDVTLTDNIPAGMTFVSAVQNSGPAFICPLLNPGDPGPVTCTTAAFPVNASAEFEFTFHVPDGTAPGTQFTNIATVSQVPAENDPNEENNQGVSVSSTAAPPQADLGIFKEGPTAAGPGTDVVYTITISNGGPDAAANLSFTDTLPGTMTFVSLDQSGTMLSCTTPAVGAGGTITCTADPYAAGASTIVTLTANVPADTPSGETFTNVSNISTTTADPNEENNTGTITTTISEVDLSVVKSGPPTAVAGTNVAYTITITNDGPDPATDVTLIDALPAGTTFVSLQRSGPGPTPACQTPPTNTNGIVVCTYDFYPAGVTQTYTLTLNARNVSSIVNTATVETGSFDTDDTNDESTVTTTVTPSADLSVVKSGPATANAGQNVTYTITASNAGPSNASTVVIEDTLPAGTTFVSIVQNSGLPFTCTRPTPGTVRCTRTSMLINASASFSLTVAVPSTTASGTQIANAVTISSATSDPDSSDDNSGVTTVINTNADLGVTKSAAATVNAGSNLTYTVTATNAGPSTAVGVVLTDTLPAGTTFVSATQTSGPVFNCTGTGPITCTIASFAPAATATFQFVVNVPPTAVPGTTLQNNVTIDSETPDNDATDDQATATTTVAASADVSVVKTAPATIIAGQNLSYAIEVTNAGPSTAANVTLTDALPAGTTLMSFAQLSGPVFNCSGTTTITCSIASLDPASPAVFDLVVNVSSSLANGTTLQNTAAIDATTSDPDPTDDQSTATTTVAASANLAVSKSGPNVVVPGTNMTYQISVANQGPSDALNVVLTDDLPDETSLVSIEQTSGPAFNCTGTTTVTCTIASFASGASAGFTFTVSVASSVPTGTLFYNTASVDSTTTDPVAANDQSFVPTFVNGSADLSVTKDAPLTVTAGENITYVINVANAGPSDATNVAVRDTLPAGTTFVSLTQTAGPTFNCTGTSAVVCTIASFAAGANASFTIVVNVPPSTAGGTYFQNTATVESTTADPIESNDQSLTTFTATATSADLGVTKSAPGGVSAGENLTYTITATNAGPSTAGTVTLTDTLPAGTTFVSFTQTAGPSFNCTGTTTVTCTIASFAPNAPATFTLIVSVPPSAATGTALLNNVTIDALTTPDPDPTDDQATATTIVGASADVAVSKSGPAMTTAGSNVTYTVAVTNNGPSNATNVTLTDSTPANTTFVSIAQRAGGPVFNCTTPAVGAPGTITCTIASLASGATSTFDLTFAVAPSTPDNTVLTNTAQVTSAADPNNSNDTATAMTTIGTGADVSITKSGPATVTSGSDATYTVTVANAGPSDAANVVMTDDMPDGTTFVSVNQSGPLFNCTTPAVGANGTITCTSASLPANTSTTFTLVFHVEPGSTGSLQNTATVTTPTDASPTNDASTTTAAIASGPTDVRITKTANANTVGPAGTATYTIVVTNLGPDTAVGAVVTDTLPAGTSLREATSTQGGCGGNTTVTCTVGDLAPNAEVTITLVVDFPATPGAYTNTATVDIANADTNGANDTDTAVVNVAPAENIPTLSSFALLALAMSLGMIVMMKMR